MNRREVLKGLVAGATACGVRATATAIEAEPQPLLLVLTVKGPLCQEAMCRLKKDLAKVRDADPRLPQIVVLTDGAELTAIVNPRPQPTRPPTWPCVTE